jgi:hypothetical protein
MNGSVEGYAGCKVDGSFCTFAGHRRTWRASMQAGMSQPMSGFLAVRLGGASLMRTDAPGHSPHS